MTSLWSKARCALSTGEDDHIAKMAQMKPRSSDSGSRTRVSVTRLAQLKAALIAEEQAPPEIEQEHDSSSSPGAEIETSQLAKPEEEEEAMLQEKCCNGLMLDMFKRRGKGTIRAALFALPEAWHEYAQDALRRDVFLSSIWEDLTEFYKHDAFVGGVPVWAKLSARAIREHVNGIVAYKRQITCLNTEVHNYLLRYRLLNTAVQPRFETVQERQNRMGDFWGKFQSCSRRNELPPLSGISSAGMIDASSPTVVCDVKEGCRVESDVKKSASAESRPVSAKSTRPMCFAPDEQWEMISRIENKNRGRTAPQEQSRSHPGIRSASALALATRQEKLSSLQPSLARPDSRRTLRSTALPRNRSGCRSNAPCAAAVASSVGRSASAPSLQDNVQDPLAPSKGMTLPPLLHSAPMLSRIQDEKPTLSLPTDTYLEACQRCWIVPTPLPFVTGHSKRFKATGRNLMDNDLRAVAAMVCEVPSIEEVDLTDNDLLTEKALVPFIERLFGEPAKSTLQRLVLRDCKHAGMLTMDAISRLLSSSDGAKNLKTLDLSHIEITSKCHLKICKAVHDHEHLESLSLADTQLGGNDWLAVQCIDQILNCPTMKILDLSWNCFDVAVFKSLGQKIIDCHLRSLRISNCCAAVIDITGNPPPITFLLECLHADKSLTHLDVSLNRMDFRSMLVIEDALECHRALHSLDLSNNPLGVLGVRSALRLLARKTSGLTHFEAAGCYSGTVKAAQTFNMTNPGGRYCLELARPYHRSILRMLYKQCEKFRHPPDCCFVGLSYSNSKSSWVHCSRNENGTYQVPNSGTLAFTFSLDAAFERSMADGLAYDEFGIFMDKHMELTKTKADFKKIVPLLAHWDLLQGRSVDQDVFLQALAKDFHLTPAQFTFICLHNKTIQSDIINRLLPCVSGGVPARSLCMLLFTHLGEFVRMHGIMRSFLDFNIENPTGHYKLTLDNCTEYAIAEQVLLLDRWEVVMGRKEKKSDTSQRGNGSHIRNETYRNRPLHLEFKNICDWTLPEVDVFEFDYISGKRAPKDALVINQSTFNNILISLFDAECSPVAKLEVLRMVSHQIYISSKQLREILGIFKEPEDRVEGFVILYLRIIDMCNAKIFRVRFATEGELQELRHRIGHATFFPFIQPENASFNLDLHFHDQRLCLNMLVMLSDKEGAQNIHDPEWIHADGVQDPLTLGVPRGWAKFDQVPIEGNFKCTYMCSPETRKLPFRIHLAYTYGSFRMDIKDEDVMWWTGLQEPPPDALEFLEFLLCNYDDPMEAFHEIDGPGGNGVITLREFEESLREMNCKKFKEGDEKQRIANLFRYLDPGGEGSVSEPEWGILSQLWAEYQLSIKEFVHFLQRTFGDDLADAWKHLDEDGSDEITLEEFLKAVENIGYFGPAKCVFGLLDRTDDGAISLEEFAILEAYKQPASSEASLELKSMPSIEFV